MTTATEQSPINFQPDEGDGTMAPAYAVVFCLNYMMGSGYLTLPRAFADAGLVWGLSILVAACVEINQCVGCAVLARSSGEEPVSPRHRAGIASTAWRTTRRFSTNAP
jgi:hypothetical protein